MCPYAIVMRRRPVPRYDDHQIDVAALVRFPPGVRAEEVDRLGVELGDQAPDDLLEHAFGDSPHTPIVPYAASYQQPHTSSRATAKSSSAKPTDSISARLSIKELRALSRSC